MQLTPEQEEELKEKLKHMSPEEIQALQKEHCLFCKIIEKSIPSKIIYEDEHCIAVLDIHPATPGHILLIPNYHTLLFAQLPVFVTRHLAKITKHLSQVLLRTLKVQGTTILVQNGELAGQKPQHAFMHIIPRLEEDSLSLSPPQNDLQLDILLVKKLATAYELILTIPEPKLASSEEEKFEEIPEQIEEQETVDYSENEEKEPETIENDPGEEENSDEIPTLDDFSDLLTELGGSEDTYEEDSDEQDDSEKDDKEKQEDKESEEDSDEEEGRDNEKEEDVEELSLDDEETEEEGDDVEELDLDELSRRLGHGL